MYLHPICSCSHWIVTLGGVGGRATRRESSSPASKLPSETSTGFPTTGCRAERLDSPKRLEMVWAEKPWYLMVCNWQTLSLKSPENCWDVQFCSLKTRSMLWKERVPGDCCWYPCHRVISSLTFTCRALISLMQEMWNTWSKCTNCEKWKVGNSASQLVLVGNHQFHDVHPDRPYDGFSTSTRS